MREVFKPSAGLRNNFKIQGHTDSSSNLNSVTVRIYVFLEKSLPLSRPVTSAIKWGNESQIAQLLLE